MTIMNLVPNTGGDLPSRRISRRIRGLMAEYRITGVKVAEAIGMNQRAFARRYSDEVDWSIDELVLVAQAFGLSFLELVSVADVTGDTGGSVPPGTTGGYAQPVFLATPRPRLALILGSVA